MTGKYLRRCHVCEHITVSEQAVRYCQGCGRSLAPFFYFKEETVPLFSDLQLRPTLVKGEFSPILGLTAQWDSP